jgi:hypothetical protein
MGPWGADVDGASDSGQTADLDRHNATERESKYSYDASLDAHRMWELDILTKNCRALWCALYEVHLPYEIEMPSSFEAMID